MDEKMKGLQDALLVMVLTPHILAYLEAHDPMALKQAKEALVAVGANPEPDPVVWTPEDQAYQGW